jgi:hypothetical protein
MGAAMEAGDFPGPPHEVTVQMKPQTIKEWEIVWIDIIHL